MFEMEGCITIVWVLMESMCIMMGILIGRASMEGYVNRKLKAAVDMLEKAHQSKLEALESLREANEFRREALDKYVEAKKMLGECVRRQENNE